MAAPMSASTLLAVIKTTGCPVKTYPGWETRRRSSGGDFNPRGVAVHITAGGLGSRTEQAYIRDIILGDPNVSFKAQFVIGPTGTIWIVGAGRANHAGSCSAKAALAFTNGSFPTSGYVDWRGADVNPGAFTYGIENIAGSKMTAAQRDASVKLCAAICKHYGWGGGEVAGHGEFASDRSYADPNEEMGDFRHDVKVLVAAKHAPTTPSKPSTGAGGAGGGTPPEKENAMPEPKDLWEWDGIPAPSSEKNPANKKWSPSSMLHWAYEGILTLRGQVSAQDKRTDDLEKKLDRIIKKLGA